MVIPFGVSVGDFIAGIKLVQDLTEALKESCSSSSDFRDLVRELYSLERALISVKNVIDPKNPESLPYDVAHVDALKQVVLQIQQTIDEFLDKNRKFLLSLGTVGGTGSSVRDWVRRFEWRRYKKEDVQALRWKVNGHSTAVTIILLGMQQEVSGKSNTLISDTSNSLDMMKTQGSNLQRLMMEVLASNLQIYREVRAVQTQVPAQVLLQEPVLFWDARGHFAPFHLDFVISAEAFIAVLKVRFKEVGLSKIERGEFVISEVATKRDIDLLRTWSRCFRPGQKVNMSMVFDLSPENKDNGCPVCGFVNSGSSDTEIKCFRCDRYYQRITDLSSRQNPISASIVTQTDRNQHHHASTTDRYETANIDEEDDDEMLSEYTRVRLRVRDNADESRRSPVKWHYYLDGRTDAPWPLPPGAQPPPPPLWLQRGLKKLREDYPGVLLQPIMLYMVIDPNTLKKVDRHSLSAFKELPPGYKAQYLPRIRCLDCPGKLYYPDPDHEFANFLIHIRNRVHKKNVLSRMGFM